MIFSLGPLQHQTPPYAGTHVTQTFGCNVLQHPLCPLSAGHVHIVEQPITFLEIVLFVPMPYQHLLMGTDKPICQAPAQDNIQLQEEHLTSDSPPAMPSTARFVAARPVNSFTSMNFVGLTTVQRTVPTGAAALNKPKPWTPIRSFILERKLCYHLDKAFVKKLIDDLCHSCTIGYNGPQFSNAANNLISAYQQPKVIDEALKKECKMGRILGPFTLTQFLYIRTRFGPTPQAQWWMADHLSPIRASKFKHI